MGKVAGDVPLFVGRKLRPPTYVQALPERGRACYRNDTALEQMTMILVKVEEFQGTGETSMPLHGCKRVAALSRMSPKLQKAGYSPHTHFCLI